MKCIWLTDGNLYCVTSHSRCISLSQQSPWHRDVSTSLEMCTSGRSTETACHPLLAPRHSSLAGSTPLISELFPLKGAKCIKVGVPKVLFLEGYLISGKIDHNKSQLLFNTWRLPRSLSSLFQAPWGYTLSQITSPFILPLLKQRQ